MAPLLIVLREERIERNRIPRDQVDREEYKISIYFLERNLLQCHRNTKSHQIGANSHKLSQIGKLP